MTFVVGTSVMLASCLFVHASPVTDKLEAVREELRRVLVDKKQSIQFSVPSAYEHDICDGPIIVMVDEAGLTVRLGEWFIKDGDGAIIARYSKNHFGRGLAASETVEIILRVVRGKVELVDCRVLRASGE